MDRPEPPVGPPSRTYDDMLGVLVVRNYQPPPYPRNCCQSCGRELGIISKLFHKCDDYDLETSKYCKEENRSYPH